MEKGHWLVAGDGSRELGYGVTAGSGLLGPEVAAKSTVKKKVAEGEKKKGGEEEFLQSELSGGGGR